MRVVFCKFREDILSKKALVKASAFFHAEGGAVFHERSSSYFKSRHPYKAKEQSYKDSALLLVRETGLSPVATLADEQSAGLFGPSDKLPSAIFSLFQVPPPL